MTHRFQPERIRTANRHLVESLLAFRGERVSMLEVMCECPSRACEDMVSVTVAEYREATSTDGVYIVRPGHVERPLEGVLHRGERHWLATTDADASRGYNDPVQ